MYTVLEMAANKTDKTFLSLVLKSSAPETNFTWDLTENKKVNKWISKHLWVFSTLWNEYHLGHYSRKHCF